MGILDDAIRQHLDLKRQHGADEGEVKGLEDEAFGPATRPGEPDFPEQESEGEASAEAPAPAAEAVPEVEGAPEPSPEPPQIPESAPEPEPTPEESSPGSFTTEERDAIAAQPTEFFDQAPAELELGELELELEDEVAESSEIVDEPVTGEEEQPPAPPSEELRAESVSEELPLEPESAERPAVTPLEEAQPEAEADAEQGEDVLEETPEFLRESPENDELWFEQGEPKDFDF